jgi:hypothetical protein
MPADGLEFVFAFFVEAETDNAAALPTFEFRDHVEREDRPV